MVCRPLYLHIAGGRDESFQWRLMRLRRHIKKTMMSCLLYSHIARGRENISVTAREIVNRHEECTDDESPALVTYM
jgi:hypothetical protein